jgi:uncharacterized protein (DUF697 family)/predicted GTPase
MRIPPVKKSVNQWVKQFKQQIPNPTDRLSSWFKVDETEIAKILEQVRSQLPTTEVILVGKPQTGKSSIVRGMTGITSDIIGQGYRPHTQHTQRYNFPAAELPLLIFTDTVGLGDGQQETADVVKELLGELATPEPTTSQPTTPEPTTSKLTTPKLTTPKLPTPKLPTSSAKLLILTVKITDFATDTLRTIAKQIRQQHPEVPCLLAVTCLHEAYPPEITNHPTYPPNLPEINRAFEQIKKDFQGLYDRALLLDFTLEEDGFDPVFYGLETLIETLASLLPEAESAAIAQLLTDRSTSDQLGNIYRDAARRYILPFAIMAGALAAVPLPLATMPVLTALQVSMVGLLGKLYGQTIKPSQAGGLVSTIAGGFVAAAIGRELVKFIPGFGSVIAASWATAYTWALGEAACVYFGDLMGGRTPDPDRIQAVMKESFTQAQARFKGVTK